MKNYKNKFKKFTLTAISVGMITSTPITSYAGFGFGDFNIQDIPNLMSQFFQLAMDNAKNALDSLTKKQEFNMQVDLAKKTQEAASAVAQAISLRQQFAPNPQACNYMRNNTALLQAGGAAKAGAAKAGSQSVKNQQLKKEKASQVNNLKSESQKQNCTVEDAQKGIYGCSKPADNNTQISSTFKGSLAGLDRNPAIVYGWVDPNAATIGDSGDGTKSENKGEAKNTGVTIPKNAFDSAMRFLEYKYYSQEPAEISNKNANGEADGANYTILRNAYLNRKGAVFQTEVNYAQKHRELEKDDKLGEFWAKAKTRTAELYGKNYVPTDMPSEQEVLRYAINSAFAKVSTAFNNLGDNEKQMLTVSMKLQYEQLEAQRDTNRILGAIFLQLSDGITPAQLDNARSAAEVRSR